jgi:Domain of unknown function (DUF4111)
MTATYTLLIMTMLLPAEVDALLQTLLARQQAILGPKLLGLYLRGSLALGAFDPLTSDIDALCVTATELGGAELEAVIQMHLELAASPSRYAKELELIYLTRAAVWRWQPDELHPTLSRGSGELALNVQHRNWVLERWSVLRGGTTVYGPPPATLIAPVSAADLQQAVTQRFHDWSVFARQPDDPNWGHRGHAAYAIETVCRMMQTLRTGTLASKAHAAAWARATFPEPWRQLVAGSAGWKSDPTVDVALNQRVQALILWGAQQAAQGFPDLR